MFGLAGHHPLGLSQAASLPPPRSPARVKRPNERQTNCYGTPTTTLNGCIGRARRWSRYCYAAELVESADGRMKGIVSDAKALQTLLGEHQDVTVARIRPVMPCRSSNRARLPWRPADGWDHPRPSWRPRRGSPRLAGTGPNKPDPATKRRSPEHRSGKVSRHDHVARFRQEHSSLVYPLHTV